MREIGLAPLLIGLISRVLPFINPNIYHILLTWINQWGPQVAWGIRGGIAAPRLGLWLRYRGQ